MYTDVWRDVHKETRSIFPVTRFRFDANSNTVLFFLSRLSLNLPTARECMWMWSISSWRVRVPAAVARQGTCHRWVWRVGWTLGRMIRRSS